MFYIRRHLLPGEVIRHQSSLHWMSFVWPLIFFFFTLALYPELLRLIGHSAPGMLLVGIGGSALLSALLRFWVEEYVVTNRRVISRYGVVRRDVFVFPLDRVEAIDVQQSLLGRILGYGTIEVHTSAEKDGSAARRFVLHPERWRAAIQGAMDGAGWNMANGGIQGDSNSNPADRLRRLESLVQEGLISQDEFQDRREEILRDL